MPPGRVVIRKGTVGLYNHACGYRTPKLARHCRYVSLVMWEQKFVEPCAPFHCIWNNQVGLCHMHSMTRPALRLEELYCEFLMYCYAVQKMGN